MKARITGRYMTPAELSRLIEQDTKADAIAVIVNCDLGDRSERALRLWCRLHQASVLRSDLTRVRAARPSLLLRGLPLEGE